MHKGTTIADAVLKKTGIQVRHTLMWSGETPLRETDNQITNAGQTGISPQHSLGNKLIGGENGVPMTLPG